MLDTGRQSVSLLREVACRGFPTEIFPTPGGGGNSHPTPSKASEASVGVRPFEEDPVTGFLIPLIRTLAWSNFQCLLHVIAGSAAQIRIAYNLVC